MRRGLMWTRIYVRKKLEVLPGYQNFILVQTHFDCININTYWYFICQKREGAMKMFVETVSKNRVHSPYRLHNDNLMYAMQFYIVYITNQSYCKWCWLWSSTQTLKRNFTWVRWMHAETQEEPFIYILLERKSEVGKKKTEHGEKNRTCLLKKM